jgi:hypothetical protein
VIEDVTLFGKATKPYENKANPRDPKNRTFFTMPVRYEFKNRDTRAEAESVLRELCKVECTTPYPLILRHCIRQVIDHMRKQFPGDYIRVTVDSDNMSLKVSRRKKGDGWYSLDDPIKLPWEVLDVQARVVPEGLRVPNLPVRKQDVEPSGEEEGGGGDMRPWPW